MGPILSDWPEEPTAGGGINPIPTIAYFAAVSVVTGDGAALWV